MAEMISAATLKRWLHDNREIAVFDVREPGQYGEGHLFHAIPLPFSSLEQDVSRLAPNRNVRLVIIDDDADSPFDSVAQRAARQLALLGYTALHILEGGTAAWQDAGYVLFKGVNLPSKAFGELVEQTSHTPRISPRALAARLEGASAPVVLDGRPFDEFQKMSIPHAICCPNGELAYRIRALIPDRERTIVINCAGRTRSIVGAQTLINLGIENPVFALENGTQGWFLEDLPLDHGMQARYDDADRPAVESPPPCAVEQARTLALRAGVEWAEAQTVHDWFADVSRTVYLCDVRTLEEFAAGSLAGARHTPGGQLQQATDQYIGVRRARLVLFDNDDIRAPVVASWLRQLGHAAFVLRDGLKSALALPDPTSVVGDGQFGVALPEPLPEPLPGIDVAALAAILSKHDAVASDAQGCVGQQDVPPVRVVDLRASQNFRDGYIPGAQWSIRPSLPKLLRAHDGPIVLISDKPATADWVAAEFPPEQRRRFKRLEGGFDAWLAAGHPVDVTPDQPEDTERIDYLFFTHDRHLGNKAAALQYLEWEIGLLSQLDDAERDDFHPLSITRDLVSPCQKDAASGSGVPFTG